VNKLLAVGRITLVRVIDDKLVVEPKDEWFPYRCLAIVGLFCPSEAIWETNFQV
jgi:hypothetical protein